MQRTAWNERTLFPKIPIIIDKENIIIAPGQVKTPVSLLQEDPCEKLTFPCHFTKERFA